MFSIMRTAALLSLSLTLSCTPSAPSKSAPEFNSRDQQDQVGSTNLARCEDFPDMQHDPGAYPVDLKIASEATTALKCAGRLDGYSERCPERVDTKSGQPLCPPSAQKIEYRGQRVFCGACSATRAEVLVFGVHMLANMEALIQIHGCAAEGRCEGWKLCTEADQPDFAPDDWITSYIGWAIAPERGFFRGDGQVGPDERRTCRPNDAALWIEAATVFARMSGYNGLDPSAKALEINRDYVNLTKALRPGCSLLGVESGGQWWTPATVALNNHGLFCMPKVGDNRRTSNICGTERLSDCYVSRSILATIAARMRHDIPLADCAPIDTQQVVCEPG